ncbi:MAG: hypothetical protein AB1793_00220 [Candidatus Thermoplasmatota archaeon]
MKADREFVRYLESNGYHPRSSKHGDRLCELLLEDMMASCPAFAEMAAKGRICYNQNQPPGLGVPLGWNIDLAIGPTSRDAQRVPGGEGESICAPPDELWVAVDAKTIMTEHGKARRNRQRDLNSFSSILHMSNPRTIVGGLVVVNMSASFMSPLRAGETTMHANIERLVTETVKLFEDLPRASKTGPSPSKPNEIDAVGVIVVDYDNVKGHSAKLVSEPPAPQLGSPLHYHSFVKAICEAFSVRFAGGG